MGIPTTYKTRYHWPKDSDLGYGVTPYKSGDRAFFEGVPKELDTLVRGEGQSVEEAEERAWAQYLKYLVCQRSVRGHKFECKDYTNGGGVCSYCGMFKMLVFEPQDEVFQGSPCLIKDRSA
jgi:hypothetical protein